MSDFIYFIFNSKESQPLENLIPDTKPLFEIYLFDYNGDIGRKYSKKDIYNLQGFTIEGEYWSRKCKIIRKSTEGKGQIIYAIASMTSHTKGDYIGIFGNDILIRISDLNRAIKIAKKKSFASFQPSLSKSSDYNFHFTINAYKTKIFPMLHKYRTVPWVDIMMSIMKSELLISSIPFLRNNISSGGLERFVFPMVSITYGISGEHAVIDASIATRLRNMETDEKIYSNGMDAYEEVKKVKKDCIDYLSKRGINWQKNKKLRALFKNKGDKDLKKSIFNIIKTFLGNLKKLIM